MVNLMNQTEGSTPEFDQKWNLLLDEFEEHNKILLENAPKTVAKFIKEINLFDCPVHSRSRNFVNDDYQLVVGLPNDKVYSLHYEVLNEPICLQHSGAGFDQNQKANWLYDEFHKVENHYEHHVLFTDGMELQIPFVFFFYRSQPWFEEE